jgi:hypothetical protein
MCLKGLTSKRTDWRSTGSRKVALILTCHRSSDKLLASHRGGPGSRPGRHVGYVVDKAALGQVLSEYFGFPANHHHHPGWHSRPIGGPSAESTQLHSTPHYTN